MMSNSSFRFKQFTIFHDRCAMKVGTDGVLLGAWTSVDNCVHILDVGTGSGLIALMMAQRCPGAVVTAIDVDRECCRQAVENVEASPFHDRIAVKVSSFQQFAVSRADLYDLIVSNPPFFSRSLLPPDAGRAHARHSVSLSLDDLLHGADRCLSPDGRLALILPADRLPELLQMSESHSFCLRRLTRVVPAPGKPVRRVLVELSRSKGMLEESQLLIEESRHHYTPEFAALVRDFYLNL